MKAIVLLIAALIAMSAYAGLPPTTVKDSGDASPKTTFAFQFPFFTGTHTGTGYSLGVLGPSGGGAGVAMSGNATSSGTAGTLVLRDGSGGATFAGTLTVNALAVNQDINAAIVVGTSSASYFHQGARYLEFDLSGGAGNRTTIEAFSPQTVDRTITWPDWSGFPLFRDDPATITGKTFGDALLLTQLTTPSTPAAGFDKCYTKSDDKFYCKDSGGTETLIGPITAGSGTVTSASVVSANGLAGTVANPTTTPAITLSTTVTGVLKGNGTAISAATSGTDYSAGTSGLATGILKSTTTTGALTIAVAGDFPTLNQSTSGNAATATALAANPTDCAANNYATTIDAGGNLTCAQVSLSAGVTGTLPISSVGAITGYSSGAGTVAATDTVVQAISKLNGNVAALGSSVLNVAKKTSAYTVTNSNDVIELDSSSGTAFTITMHSAATATSKPYRFKMLAGSYAAVTIVFNSTDTADGETSIILTEGKQALELIPNSAGTGWDIF